MRLAILAAALVFGVITVAPARACNTAQPQGAAILVIEGLIESCGGTLDVKFDRAMLHKMPRKVINTQNPWVAGVNRYEGVLLRDLMSAVHADGTVMTISALDDFRADMTAEEVRTIDVILADTFNGKDMDVRNKGPLFVIFPFTDEPNLAVERHLGQSVWQVNRITVK